MLGTLLCGGCTKKIYVPVESARLQSDTLTRICLRSDTFLARDSVVVTLREKDTIRERLVRERWRVRTVRDTVRDVRRDTIVKTVAVGVSDKESSRGLPGRVGRTVGWILTGILAWLLCRLMGNRWTRGGSKS